MGHPPHDVFNPSATGGDRSALDRVFKAGANARRNGESSHDNPYAVGSEERDEWAAGWSATPELEADDEDNAPL